MSQSVSFDLSPELVAALREARARQPFDPVAENHDAVLVASFLSGVYLTLDGRVLQLDYIEEDAEVVEVTNSKERYVAVVCGARQLDLPELLDLLPVKPAGAADCFRCDGTRWFQFASKESSGQVVCPECAGLGWLSTREDIADG